MPCRDIPPGSEWTKRACIQMANHLLHFCKEKHEKNLSEHSLAALGFSGLCWEQQVELLGIVDHLVLCWLIHTLTYTHRMSYTKTYTKRSSHCHVIFSKSIVEGRGGSRVYTCTTGWNLYTVSTLRTSDDCEGNYYEQCNDFIFLLFLHAILKKINSFHQRLKDSSPKKYKADWQRISESGLHYMKRSSGNLRRAEKRVNI